MAEHVGAECWQGVRDGVTVKFHHVSVTHYKFRSQNYNAETYF